MAELNLDAATDARSRQDAAIAAEDTAGIQSHLEACADWLALAQEADLLSTASAGGLSSEDAMHGINKQSTNPEMNPSEQPSEDQTLSVHQAQLAIRFSWASGRLADCHQDHQSAILHFTNTLTALMFLPHLNGSTSEPNMRSVISQKSPAVTEDPEESASISMRHCRHDAFISCSTILAKLQVLKLAESRQEASSLLEAGAASEALALLQQDLLQDPAFAAKASRHDAAGFVKSLQLLMVSDLADGHVFAALQYPSLAAFSMTGILSVAD